MTQRLDYNQIAPGAVKALGGVYGYVSQSGLPSDLIELVYLRISQINNCAFCLDMHSRALAKMGVIPEKLALVQAWAEAGDLFTATECAALAWAESVTRVAETGVPAEDFAAARELFNEKQLVDLTVAVGLMNAYNRMAISFRNTRFQADPIRHSHLIHQLSLKVSVGCTARLLKLCMAIDSAATS